MQNKKVPIAVGLLAIVAVGVLIAYHVRKSAALQQTQTPTASGVANADAANAGLTTEPMPQLSDKKFEPPPSMGAGSYTVPAPPQDSTKKGQNAR